MAGSNKNVPSKEFVDLEINMQNADVLVNSSSHEFTNRVSSNGNVKTRTFSGINKDADDLFDSFNSTFSSQFTYKRVGNISDYVGQSIPEIDKLNAYQYPDDSYEWYGPIQSQTFPILIPANPSIDSGWALISGASRYWVRDNFSNPNLLLNHNFIKRGDSSLPPPGATPISYPPGFEIFKGVFANNTTGATITYIGGKVDCTLGDYYFKVINTNALFYVQDFVASVADFNGEPRLNGVSFQLVDGEYIITVDPTATDVASVKFEQGTIETKHEFTSSDSNAVISFIFDDGYASAITDVIPLFKSKGMTCGFAVSSSLMDSSSATYARIQDMLNAQSDGFEIINHGLNPTPLITDIVGEPFARSQINGNYDDLVKFGFNVQSYVAGNSVLAPSFLSIVKERHSSAYTVDGSSKSGIEGLQHEPVENYELFRPSLFSIGLNNAKATVDAAKLKDGWVTFFDHDPSQVFYPSSMSLIDLEALLDYIIAEGVNVVNPSDARNDLGRDERIKNQDSISESNREQGLAVVNQNLLRDPWYKTINESYSGWGISTITGNASFTPSNRSNGIFGNEIQLSIGSNGTVIDGQYIYQSTAQRRVNDFFPNSGNLTFSCEPYQTNSAFDDNFELTIGVNQRKTSDNSVINSVESDPLKVDAVARKYSVTIDTADYSNATYFQVYYKITEKITGIGASIQIANPKFEQGDKATIYTSDAPVDINDWDFAETIVDIDTTNITSGSQLFLVDVNRNFYMISNNQFVCRDTGFYSFDLTLRGVVGGPYVNTITGISTAKNSVVEGGKIVERSINGVRLEYDLHETRYMKSGDTLHWLLNQSYSGSSIQLDTGVRSFIRICKIS